MKKTALITGASSGIGRDIARNLSKRGYNLVLVARRAERLNELKDELDTEVMPITADLSKRSECVRVYNATRKMNICVLVNCAGFGATGSFDSIELKRELEMIDVNVSSLHILTKLFLHNFIKRDRGYILNVASSAGLMRGGPMMATYYATKSYVVSLTNAISQELKSSGSHVYIGSLCPGPVKTEFDDVANNKFSINGISSNECADYAVEMMFRRKRIIIPGTMMKALCFVSKFSPLDIQLAITEKIQKKKC